MSTPNDRRTPPAPRARRARNKPAPPDGPAPRGRAAARAGGPPVPPAEAPRPGPAGGRRGKVTKAQLHLVLEAILADIEIATSRFLEDVCTSGRAVERSPARWVAEQGPEFVRVLRTRAAHLTGLADLVRRLFPSVAAADEIDGAGNGG